MCRVGVRELAIYHLNTATYTHSQYMTKRLRVTLLPKPHARINAGMLQGSGHGTLNKAHSCSHPGIFQLSCFKKKKKQVRNPYKIQNVFIQLFLVPRAVPKSDRQVGVTDH